MYKLWIKCLYNFHQPIDKNERGGVYMWRFCGTISLSRLVLPYMASVNSVASF